MGDLLLITIQTELYDSLGINLKNDIAEKLERYNSKGILLDISSLSVVDSFMGRIINNVASIAKLMGAETVLVGMQPAVAMTLVELGLEMPHIITALNVEKGMELLMTRLQQKENNDWHSSEKSKHQVR
jgi:rsbT antagonist protein RsbS